MNTLSINLCFQSICIMQSRTEPEGQLQSCFLENQTKPYLGWMSCEMEPETYDMLHNDLPVHWTQQTQSLCTTVTHNINRITATKLEAELTSGVNLDPLSVLDSYHDTVMEFRYLESSCEETLYEDSNMTLIIDDVLDAVTSQEGVHHVSHGYNCDSDNQQVPDFPGDYELLTREVEGCEDPELDTNRGNKRESLNIEASAASSRKHRALRTSSTKRKRESVFVPRASSTMIENNTTPSTRVKVSRKSKPCASSTMIIEDNSPITCDITGHGSPEVGDLQSIYTWSIHDSSHDASFEESFMKDYNLIVKPPVLKRNTPKHVSCESFSFTMDSLSCPSELDNDRESMYEKDEDICGKTNSVESVSDINKVNDPEIIFHGVQTADVDSTAFQTDSEFHEVPSCSMGDDDVFFSIHERLEPTEILHQVAKSSKLFKFPKNTLQLKKLFKWKKSKGKTSDQHISNKGVDSDSSAMCHSGRQQVSRKTTDFITVQDRKTVMTNFKRFKANVN